MRINLFEKFDVAFNYESIYIKNLYLPTDKANIYDKHYIYDGFIDKIYSKTISKYCEVDSAFNGILSLGELFFNNYELNKELRIINEDENKQKTEVICMKSVEELILEEKKLIEILEEWLEENHYPYSQFNKDNFTFSFYRDCSLLYALFDIHKWLFKIKNVLKSTNFDIQNDISFDKLRSSLKFIELDSFNVSNLNEIFVFSGFLDDDNEINYSDYEVLHNFIIEKDEKLNPDTLSKLCDVIKRNIIFLLLDKFNKQPNEFQISAQNVIFNPSKNDFTMFKSANSIIGVVYHKLLMDLSETEESLKRNICFNRNCNNHFPTLKGRKRLYCQSTECQKLRHRINAKESARERSRRKKQNEINSKIISLQLY